MNTPTIDDHYGFDIWFSDHDRGWYAEIFERKTGREVHSTHVFRDKYRAWDAAYSWIAQQRSLHA